MFDCGLSSVLRWVMGIVSRLAANELNYIMHAQDNFNELQKSLMELQNQLRPLDIWHEDEEKVKGLRLCYEVEDFIYDTNCVVSEEDPQLQHTDGVYRALHPRVNPMGFLRHKELPRKIGGKLEAMQKYLKQKSPIPKSNNNNAETFKKKLEFDFKQVESKTTQVRNIIKELTSQDSKGVSIIGLRGMGKRALATYIFNHSDVKTRFPLILKASFQPDHIIIVRVDGSHGTNITLQFLSETADPWLLWMDDLPKMPILAWQEFLQKFKQDMKGKFLFTTVNPDVANMTETSLHYMATLSDICCQHLITNCKQSRGILNKCYGLLLIAQFLVPFANTDSYERICDTELWQMKAFREELLPYLASKFESLEGATLKCFYYLSLFPQEHQFDKEEMILLWIGAGLVEATCKEVSSILHKGQATFDDLLKNSILQQVSTDEGSKYQLYKFSHGFAQFVAPKIYLSLSESSQTNALNRDLCHLSVAHNIQPDHQEDIKVHKCLRTFISICDSKKHGRLKEIQADLFSQMIDLRVLVLKNTDIVDVPYIRHLKRLRLLDISETLVQRLPEDLCSLPTLQILKFKKSRTDKVVVQLPNDFSKMTSLVFVDWDVSCMKKLLANQPDNIGRLVHLETLPLFVVTNKKGYHITELEKMDRLQNSLCITNLEAVANEEDAEKARISMKTSLQSLELEWTKFPKGGIAKEVLSGLQPHSGLKELHVVNYRLYSYPTWFGEPSFKLETIHLENCSSCNLLQSFGQLSALEVLHLERMHNLVSMDNLFHRTYEDSKSQYFRKLKSLVLSSMEDLRDWKKLEINDMPQLEKLEIKDCHNLKSLPPLENLTSLKHIEIEGCEKLSSLLKLPSSLQSLIIKGSNSLASRCKPQGQDWLKLGRLLKLEIDSLPIELPATKSSKTESPPFQQTSANPLTETFKCIYSGNAKSLTDQPDNATVPKAPIVTGAGLKMNEVKATGGIVIRDNAVQSWENRSGMNGPRIADYEKGKGKLDDASHSR